ncbi:MAG: hypothetical protein RSA10_02115 [Bacilli bacterium]
MNNKGQSLVLFVIFLPVLIIMGTYVIDLGLAKYNANFLNHISEEVVMYGLKHINEDPNDKMVNLIHKNDLEIESYEIKIDPVNNKITLQLEKNSKGLFGSFISEKTYKIISRYEGTKENDEFIIERKGK